MNSRCSSAPTISQMSASVININPKDRLTDEKASPKPRQLLRARVVRRQERGGLTLGRKLQPRHGLELSSKTSHGRPLGSETRRADCTAAGERRSGRVDVSRTSTRARRVAPCRQCCVVQKRHVRAQVPNASRDEREDVGRPTYILWTSGVCRSGGLHDGLGGWDPGSWRTGG